MPLDFYVTNSTSTLFFFLLRTAFKGSKRKKRREKKNYSLYHSSIAHLRLTKLEISQKEKRGKKSKTGNIL